MNGAIRSFSFAFARAFFIGNIMYFMLSIWAIPVYRKMHPVEYGHAVDIVHQVLLLLDACCSYLMFRDLWWKASLFLFLTSTIFMVSAIWGGIEISIKSIASLALLYYWDVLACLILIAVGVGKPAEK